MAQLHRAFATLALSVLTVHPSFAVPPSQKQVDLNNCQKAVKVQGTKFLRAEILAVGACLQKISVEQVKNNAAIDKAAGRACITQFRKLHDSRNIGKSLVEKLTTNIKQKCDNVYNPDLQITIGDITGSGNTVPQPLFASRLDLSCQAFGGASIASVQDWVDCLVAAHQCEAEQAISEQYPRAAEWLNAVKPLMNSIPSPGTDGNKTADAVTGLTNVHNAIDANNDNVPDITCPLALPPGSCQTACCYIEQSNGSFRPTSCLEYTGTPTEVSTFMSNCTGKDSNPSGFYTITATSGACSAGPTFGKACVVGGAANNAVAIPKDSACP